MSLKKVNTKQLYKLIECEVREVLLKKEDSTANNKNKEKKSRVNIDGEDVPYICSKCGGNVGIKIRGNGSYVCEKCHKNYGLLPVNGYVRDDSIDRIIRETVTREIQSVLFNEDNSINKEVDEEAKEVYDIICDHKYTEDERVNDDICDEVYQITLKREFLGKKMLYIFRYYVFNDDKRHNLDCGCSVIDKYGGTVYINYDLECCPMSYGDLHDSIQHELTHILKLMMSFGKNPKYRPLTRNIVSAINAFYASSNEYEKAIGCVFYMGLNDEQDAYINGLYASIKEGLLNGVQPCDIVKQSPLYQKVRELIEIRSKLDSYFSNEEFLKAIALFKQYSKYKNGLTKETFLKKINYTLERIKKKFFNMLKAYQKFMTRGGAIVHGDVISLIIQQFLS